MAGMIYDLIEILNVEDRLYGSLIKHGNDKRTHIVKGNIEEINASNIKEEAIVVEMMACERKRNSLMQDIASILNLKPDTITITQIEEAMKGQPDEAKALGEIKTKLARSLKELKIVNDENMLLVNQSLEYADFSINVMQSSLSGTPMTANYGGSADKRSDSFFDAKQ